MHTAYQLIGRAQEHRSANRCCLSSVPIAAFSKRYRLADVRTSGNLCLHSRFPDVFSALPIGPLAKMGGAGGREWEELIRFGRRL